VTIAECSLPRAHRRGGSLEGVPRCRSNAAITPRCAVGESGDARRHLGSCPRGTAGFGTPPRRNVPAAS